ncbi:response regulator [Synechococcus sp. W65.1]|uniref:hybrid sensor histidine kinase/response regulator n=1 Tax=Synechococcus sp. W65.1 TaxID=2964526 RepID=UPI0039C38616
MQKLEVSPLAGSNSASAEKGLLLLIVDDDPSQRLLARYALEREGYHILEADSGLACLEAASRYQPDIVLLDAVMPGLDGFECCRRLHAQNPDMPILIVTALEDEAFVNEAFAAGASDYIPKPIHWSVLKRRLHHLLQVSQAQRRLQQLNQELEAKVKERTAQLACQVADLEQLNRLKDHFLAAVSHELRTPLTKIRLALELLGRTPLNEKQRQYQRIALEECQAEIELINRLLDLQGLEAKELSSEAAAIDLQGLCKNLLDEVRERLQARQLKLETAELTSLPTAFYSYPQQLTLILKELLENACKFTQPGGTLRLEVQAFPGGVELRIGNTAQIEPEHLPHIFERFYRVPTVDPWTQPGSGLGLALVKQWVEYLRGHIQVTSQKGWTWFVLRLPSLVPSNP